MVITFTWVVFTSGQSKTDKGPVFVQAHHSHNVAIVHTWQM